MEVKKVLYATNLKEPTYNLFEGLLGIKKIGLEEIILLSCSPPDHLKEELSVNGISPKGIEAAGPFVSRILNSAKREDVSLIVANLKREERATDTQSETKLEVPYSSRRLTSASSYHRNIYHTTVFNLA